MPRHISTALLIAIFASLTAKASVIRDYEAHHLFPYPEANAAQTQQPSKPEIESPEFFARVNGTASLKWQSVAEASGYHVQVATDPNFKWIVLEDYHYQNTTIEVGNLEEGKHYHWRVLAVKRSNDSSWMKSAWNSSMFTTQK
jgi:hypothetical protein